MPPLEVDREAKGDYHRTEDENDGDRFSGTRGHRYFGFCCDMRRAVIAMSFVHGVLVVLGAVYLIAQLEKIQEQLIALGYPAESAASVPVTIKNISSFSIANTEKAAIVIAVLSVIFDAIGAIGAATFKKPIVIVGLVWIVALGLMSLISTSLSGIVLAGIVIYPYVMLLNEMTRGIISPTTYQREEFCCLWV